ncbi:MAG: hypothetical protein EOP04_20620 [Proteobacteria bacterium]|nr:MAG: hypothetical protein EOP04_20620 [Pseudomonadota bacterium]
MVVRNYYNHTAPTYRGLMGQYCSMFPTYGGTGGWDSENISKLPPMDKLCANHVFEQNGYRSVFFDAHRKDNAFVDEMMKSIGIGKVWTAEEISQSYLNSAEPKRNDALTDHQFLQGFIGWLKTQETSLTNETVPFMVGLYNLETHAWQNTGDDGYPYGDGTNNSLNTIHNFDHSFGLFWDYFKKSELAQNTIVILTSDHSHYSEESYVAAMRGDADYQPLFVDKIPLIIYDPTRDLPSSFDANYSTSIDFAPSLIHLMGFPNTKNPFLGTSLFMENRKVYEGLGLVSIGEESFLVDEDMIHSPKESEKRTVALKLADKVMRFSKKCELENRLWNTKWNHGVLSDSETLEIRR